MAAVAAVYPYIVSLGADVVAISTDSVHTHQAFKRNSPDLLHLPFPLASDRNHSISSAYGVMDARTGNALRASIFVDPDQKIQAKLIYPGLVGRSIQEHVRLLEGLQQTWKTGKGVPADWNPSKG